MTKKQREDTEYFICKFLDALDKTGTNSEYVQQKWAKMSDIQFVKWLEKDYPLQLQVRAWEIEPTFKDYQDAAKVIGIKLTDKLALPYLYKNKEGIPVNSKECLILYIHFKKVQQFITKKNKVSPHIDNRDITGRLATDDKGAAMSDKEMESLAINSQYNTMEEFGTFKADALNAKSMAYNQIAATGTLSKNDYYLDVEDSLARNMMSNYLLACHISTNLVNKEGLTPYTLKERERKVQR